MRTERTRGFSLIEATVAVAIVGTMILSTSYLLARIPVSGRETKDQDVALKIARGELEVLRAGGYDALPATGPFQNPLLTSLASSTATVTVNDFSSSTKQVTATVSWRGAQTVRSLTLTTLITKDSKLP